MTRRWPFSLRLGDVVEKAWSVGASLTRSMMKRLTKLVNACDTTVAPPSATAERAPALVAKNVGMSEAHRQAASGVPNEQAYLI